MAMKSSNHLQQEVPPGSATTDLLSEYVRQHRVLLLVRHINPLIIAIQQHRGASLALLEGDESFTGQVSTLRQDITTRLNIIRSLNALLGYIMPDDQCREIEERWEVFVSKWREDGVIGNFEFHNELIEQLMAVLIEIVEDARYFSPTSQDITVSAEGRTTAASLGVVSDDQLKVVELVTRDIPMLIENIARTRGLSVHMAVLGRCEPDQKVMLNQLLQTIIHKKERIRTTHRGLSRETLKSLPALMETLLHEHKLVDLLVLIKEQILLPESIDIDSHMLFRFATEIIQVYSAVIEQGISLIQRNLDASVIA